MIASLVILVLVLLGFLWWWIAQPHGRDALGRDAQLPLFSVRTPGSKLRVIGVGARRPRAAAAATSPAATATSATAPTQSVAPPPPPPTAPPTRPSRAQMPMPMSMPVDASLAAANGASATLGVVSANGAGTASSPAPTRPRHDDVSLRPAPRVASAASSPPTLAKDGNGAGSALEELKWAPPIQPVPANGTVEFLPGRLDVVQGRGVAGQEVRFVRPTRPGERAAVTFGRGEGQPYRHVQLNVPTVSRLHARLSLDAASGGWAVENLSSTNPTVLNGEELPAGEAPRLLHDGDRLEMGEVVFTYHER